MKFESAGILNSYGPSFVTGFMGCISFQKPLFTTIWLGGAVKTSNSVLVLGIVYTSTNVIFANSFTKHVCLDSIYTFRGPTQPLALWNPISHFSQ